MKPQIYRHDINSLRFFAVLLVFFSHISVSGFVNGFIGVDIFFVISGFFITTLLNQKLNKREILDFLIRRIKRLIPNLFLICFLIFFCSLIFLPDYVLKNLYLNFFSSIFGFANINFIVQSKDYFGPSSEINPFLHIWSLSVEKHFYIIFLTIFIFFSNYFKKFKFIFILSISLLSLLLSMDLSGINHFYYLTPLRIFEFGIGCLVCMLNIEIKKKNQNILSIIALAILMLSMLLIDSNKGIPGWQVFFPCFAIGIILITPKSKFNQLISIKPLSYLGKLSYLIYLIHWPLIIFLSFHFKLTVELKVIIFFATLLSSSFLYHFYEKKMRFGKKIFQIFLFCSSIIILFISYLNFNNFSSKQNNSFQNKFLKDRSLRYELKESPVKKSNSNQILFIGDSFAGDLYNALSIDSFQVKGKKVQKIHIDTICYNLSHRRPWLGRIIKKIGTCEKQREELKNTISQNQPNVIILVNHWKSYNYKFVMDAIKTINISTKTKTKLIIVGMRDTFKKYDQIFSRNIKSESINKEFYYNRNNIEQINNFLKEISNQNSIHYFQPLNPCDLNKLKCALIDEVSGEIKYYDYSHYTLGYSKKIMNEIKKIIK